MRTLQLWFVSFPESTYNNYNAEHSSIIVYNILSVCCFRHFSRAAILTMAHIILSILSKSSKTHLF